MPLGGLSHPLAHLREVAVGLGQQAQSGGLTERQNQHTRLGRATVISCETTENMVRSRREDTQSYARMLARDHVGKRASGTKSMGR